MSELNTIEEINEQEKFTYIQQVLNQLKEAITENEEETISNIRKIIEKLTNSEELKIITDMLQKAEIYGDFKYETISKLIKYNYDNTLFKYLKLFVEVADSIMIDTFNYSALIYFYIKVSKEKDVEFSQIEIDYNEKQYNIILSRNNNINDINTIEQVNKALLNVLLNIEVSIKEVDEQDNT